MNNIPLSPDAALVRKIRLNCFHEAIDTAASLALIRESNRYFLATRANRPPTRRAAALIRKALFVRVLIFVARAYAPVRKGDRHTRKAFDLLAEPAIFEEVASDGSRQRLKQAQQFWRRLDGSPRYAKLKHYRDKDIAHLGERNRTITTPVEAELVNFANSTIDVWVRLAHGVGATGLDLASQVGVHQQSAAAFWRALIASAKGDGKR